MSDLIFFTESPTTHNFAGDNTLSAVANAGSNLLTNLESAKLQENENVKMKVNPDKFCAIPSRTS